MATRPHVDRLRAQLRAAAARVGEQIVDQRPRAGGAGGDVIDVLAIGVAEPLGGPLLEQFGEAGDRAQWLAEVVRSDVGELLEVLVGGAQLGVDRLELGPRRASAARSRRDARITAERRHPPWHPRADAGRGSTSAKTVSPAPVHQARHRLPGPSGDRLLIRRVAPEGARDHRARQPRRPGRDRVGRHPARRGDLGRLDSQVAVVDVGDEQADLVALARRAPVGRAQQAQRRRA